MMGRRQPCPCGSGKQYRKCCEKKDKSKQGHTKKIFDFDRLVAPFVSQKTGLASKPKIDPDSVEVNIKNFEITDGILRYIGKDKIVKIPESINGEKIKIIGEEAFAGSKVEVVFLPNGIEEIENKAFDQCIKLRQINFPEGLKRIGRWSFQGCHSLQELDLPQSLEILDGYAFDECSNLSKVSMPQKMQTIGAYAFSQTNIRFIKIPEGIEFLGNSLFYECTNLEFVEMPEGIKEILNMTFAECHSLDNLFLPKSLKAIGQQAFQNCINLKTLTIQGKIESIAKHAFLGCENLQGVISSLKKGYKVEILDPQYEMLKAFMGDVSKSEYEREYNTKFKQTSIERLLQVSCISSKPSDFWTSLPVEGLTIFQESRKMEVYLSLGIELEKRPEDRECEETIYVEGLTNHIEEDITEKDLYVEALTEGYTLKQRGDIEGAIAKYKEAINFKPLISTAYYNLGKVLYIQKEYEASARSYKMAIQLGQDEYEVLRHMGHSLLDGKMRHSEYQDVILQYEEGINPSLRVKRMMDGTSKSFTVSKKRADKYDDICIRTAEEYLKQDLES